MNKTIFARLKIPKVKAATLSKGQDGATWHLGAPCNVTLCKKGDFCFDPDTFDIYKCIKGGNADISQWECVCNLNNLDKINEFINSNRNEIEKILENLNNQAEKIKNDVQNIINQIEASPAYKPWWFGTREEYNSMSEEERNIYDLHFIEEGS